MSNHQSKTTVSTSKNKYQIEMKIFENQITITEH